MTVLSHVGPRTVMLRTNRSKLGRKIMIASYIQWDARSEIALTILMPTTQIPVLQLRPSGIRRTDRYRHGSQCRLIRMTPMLAGSAYNVIAEEIEGEETSHE